MSLDHSQLAQIRSLISEIIEVEEQDLQPDRRFSEDYGVDSLRAIEIMAELEKRFMVTISPEVLGQMTTFNHVCEIMDGLVSARETVACDATGS